MVIRQKTCLMAPGSDFRGLAVSAAARPISSVPVKEKAEVTRTLQNPLKPFLNAPGFAQYFPPIYPLSGSPPMLMTMARRLWICQ